MYRLVLFIVPFVLVACGSGETPSAPAGSETPPVEAREAAPQPAAEMGGAVQVANCLDLVGSGKYEEAVPVCLEAARLAPDNTDVEEALATAQQELARARAEGSAEEVEKAAAGAAKEAAGQVEQTGKELTEGLPE